MAARPTWKGYLKVSLVTIPVKVFPATESAATIAFNQLHRECNTRIQMKKWCPTCDREVPNSEIVKGYEHTKGNYVVMEEEDISKVRVESTRVIDLAQFADESEIDPIYVDRAYYLAPDGPMAAQSFAVMREGMAGKAGIGKVALYGREYLVAVRPKKKGLVMYTLHHDAEIRAIEQIEELDAVPSKVKPEEMKLAKQVIGSFESELNLKDYTDEYKEGLRKIIEAKIAGEGGRDPRGRGAAEGRGPDGGAAAQPERGQHGEEEAGQDRNRSSRSRRPRPATACASARPG